MARSGALKKEKKTYSLSKDSVGYLEERVRRERRRSVSELLDELIQEKKLAAEQQRISENIRNYYDSISKEEQEENRLWGEFAESQFPK
jgi:hypothetical protein